ncbi:MAG: glycosyltransferase [Gemmatimonadetes bacterium]|nr:glycosyltransferase [Gemmatimonadota bacterium]
MRETPRSVFLDPSGWRWRQVRRLATAAGMLTTLLAAVVVAGVLLPPLLPGSTWSLAPSVPARAMFTRADRETLAARRRLQEELRKVNAPPVRRPARLPLVEWAGPARPKGLDEPIIAGFYVNWDDNSFVSLKNHATRMDWVICEWAFVDPSGDSLQLKVDRRVPYTLRQLVPDEAERPQILLMVSNAQNASTFDVSRLRRLVSRPAVRKKVVAQIASAVTQYGLGGVTIDFENIPAGLEDDFLAFSREVRAAMQPIGRLTTQAVAPYESIDFIRRLGALNDHVIMMLYDEHSQPGAPGPVASQAWYVRHAREAIAALPPRTAILGIGAYGYDWSDATGRTVATNQTFQDVMKKAGPRTGSVRVDPQSLTPFLAWTDADSSDHLTWYLDATTAWNQIRAGARLGAAGHAIWRLGSEDPSLWGVLSKHGLDATPRGMEAIPGGYDVEFEGDGEILRLAARPTDGRRRVTTDAATGLITGQALESSPLPYVVKRTGSGPKGEGGKKIALTFDDGPDGTWTAPILDTLRTRGAPATFFVIGQNVERHIRLMRRVVREGHEFGNHTWSHPNLALVPRFIVRLEIAANSRLLEAVLDRRSVFFRPPYFGDAEPTTADELDPVEVASNMGYITAGVHVDSDDWRNPPPDSIVKLVLAARERGNVVLLHDGGGNRASTLAAIGPLVDSLRARGDTLVLLSALAGVPHDEAILPLPPRSAAQRAIELATFGMLGVIEVSVYWLFLVAVVLGVGRLLVILALAAAQRFGPRGRLAPYHPSVTVLVPAYNEERVIVATIDSLLAQRYPGALDVIVIDDGSPDGTWDVATAAYGQHPRVHVLRKPNGGKASALNAGLATATGEVVVCMDADTVFEADAVMHLVAPLADPGVGAVAGNAKVGNRINLVTRWQALEYVTSQNMDRRAFSLLDCITVVPGAVGAWRTALVRAVGGFSDDTLAEDQDLTLALRRRGHSIAYAEDAVAWTEAPDTLRALSRQRFRWSFGTLQCSWKHRDVLFRPRYGTLGFIAMPNVWVFQLLFTVLSPLADLMFAWSLFSVLLMRYQHGAEYALPALENVLFYYAIFLLVDWIAAVLAFVMEPGEDLSLTWLIPLQRFAYRQVMYAVVVRSFHAAIRGRIVGWGTQERKATVDRGVVTALQE